MKKDIFKEGNGFTLIEFLVYSVIVTFIMGALILTGINIMNARAKITVTEEVNHNAKIIIGTITNYIRSADGFTVTGTNILSLQMPVFEDNPTEFRVVDGVLTIKRGDYIASPVTTEMVRIKNIEFRNISSKAVKLMVTIEYSNPSGREQYDLEKTFYVTENIRK